MRNNSDKTLEDQVKDELRKKLVGDTVNKNGKSLTIVKVQSITFTPNQPIALGRIGFTATVDGREKLKNGEELLLPNITITGTFSLDKVILDISQVSFSTL